MNKLYDVFKKNQSKIVFVTKYIMIMECLLTALPFFNRWLYDVNKLMCAWSLFLVLFLFFSNKSNFCTKEYIVLVLFCCSYALTIILNKDNHLINEIMILAYTMMSFFTLTYCDRKKKREDVVNEIVRFSWLIVVVIFVFSCINIIIYISDVGGYVDYTKCKYLYGVVTGQLGGIYNPNTGATLNYISAIISLILLNAQKKRKKFLVLNIIVQSVCFFLVQSRGAWICLISYILIYFLTVRRNDKYSTIKNIVINLFGAVLLCGVLIVCGKGIRHGIFQIVTSVSSDQVIGMQDKKDRVKVESDDLNEVSTGRVALWEAAVPAYKESPVFGIGFRSIDDALKENLTRHQYKNSANGGLHNIYLTVLVSSGTIGFFFFAMFIMLILNKIRKIIFKSEAPEYIKCMCLFIPVWLVGELAESRIILGVNFLAISFWIVIGYVLYFAKESERIGQPDHTGL